MKKLVIYPHPLKDCCSVAEYGDKVEYINGCDKGIRELIDRALELWGVTLEELSVLEIAYGDKMVRY